MPKELHEIKPVECADYTLFSIFLERNNVPEITRHFNPFPLTHKSAENICCGSHRDRYYIAIMNGDIVGMCMLRGWDQGFDTPSFGVMVDMSHHGKGIGRVLTCYAIDQAQALGCPSIRLTVHKDNPSAIHLYHSLGFKESDDSACSPCESSLSRTIMMRHFC